MCALASCTAAERNLFWDNAGQPRTLMPLHAQRPPPLCYEDCPFTPWKLSALLLCPLIFHLPQHILRLCSRSARKNIYSNVLMQPYEFVWVCVIRGVVLWQGDIEYARLVGCFYCTHVEVKSQDPVIRMLLWNKDLNFDLQSWELHFNHGFIKKLYPFCSVTSERFPWSCILCCFGASSSSMHQ